MSQRCFEFNVWWDTDWEESDIEELSEAVDRIDAILRDVAGCQVQTNWRGVLPNVNEADPAPVIPEGFTLHAQGMCEGKGPYGCTKGTACLRHGECCYWQFDHLTSDR